MEETAKTLASNDDITNLRKEMREDFADFRDEFKSECASCRLEFSLEIAKTIIYFKDEITSLRLQMMEWRISNLKWMFFFLDNAGDRLLFYFPLCLKKIKF